MNLAILQVTGVTEGTFGLPFPVGVCRSMSHQGKSAMEVSGSQVQGTKTVTGRVLGDLGLTPAILGQS